MEGSNDSPQSLYQGMRVGVPFNFKVGQVFTGFGIGCGVGIGVGRPLNLAAIPVLHQVMSAAQGATGSFSVIGRHVNTSLRKLGVKNVEAGIGCGVGFGHGFGVGFALKPGVISQFKTCLVHITSNMISKFGIAIRPDMFPTSMKSVASLVTETPGQNKVGSLNLDTKGSSQTEVNNTSDEVVKADFQSFGPKGIKELNDKVVQLQLENDMIKMVLKHQKAIEELVADSEKMKHMFLEKIRTPGDRDQDGSSTVSASPRNICFNCRRKQRRNI